jgi:hypothetical protein
LAWIQRLRSKFLEYVETLLATSCVGRGDVAIYVSTEVFG